MKKKKLSNKTKIILTGLALVVSLVGTTYAWWNTQVESSHEVTMGNMKLEGNFPELESEVYEPGTSLEADGTLKNKGTIPILVKLENKSQVKFAYRNDALATIPQAEQKFEKDTVQAIKLTLAPKSGLYSDSNNPDVFWFSDPSGNRYILMDPGSELAVTTTANFDGSVMGAKYQDAVIKVNTNYRGTQVLEGAINSEFGINSSDLSILSDTKARSITADPHAVLGMNHLHDLLDRK